MTMSQLPGSNPTTITEENEEETTKAPNRSKPASPQPHSRPASQSTGSCLELQPTGSCSTTPRKSLNEGSNETLQQHPASGGQELPRSTTQATTPDTSPNPMRRFSRAAIHPMLGVGLAIREAFGPRVTMMDTSYERTAESDTPSPVGEQYNDRNISITKGVAPYEDSMGGLEGVFSAEEHGAIPSYQDTVITLHTSCCKALAILQRKETKHKNMACWNTEVEQSVGTAVKSQDASSYSNSSHIECQKLPDTETLLFRDGKRRIDMVLVYEEEDYGVMTLAEVTRREMRRVFQENLIKEGLELELEEKQMAFDQEKFFLKVHVPWKALTRYAEVMNMKMPIKEVGDDRQQKKGSLLPHKFMKIFEYNHARIPKEPSFYTATYRQDKEEQFIIKDRETFFTAAQRSQVVWQIMMRAKYDDSEKVGIRRLLNNGTYLAAFPLHEGSYRKDSRNGINLDRRLLYSEWACPSRWYKKQPLWLIKKYFGEKIGLYFAWLGFYTKMLIPASVVGLLCFFYGLLSMNSSDNIPSMEICDPNIGGNITMCPLCDKVCDYQKLNSSCVFAEITYLFDNPATVFFAIFMSFWATTFLELWKRQQAVIVWEWDLQNVEEDEEPRPEFETSVKTFRTNPVTMEREPYLPTWSRAWRFLATSSAVMFMVVVVMGAVLGTIIYRISVVTVIYGSGEQFLKKHAKIFTSITAAVINLVIIMILTKLYQRLALWLTNLENPRTQTEYEDSYTFKIFVFQFVNFYSSLIYIAFFKGRFFVHPGDVSARNSAFTRLKIDVCDPAGCLSELCIQLSIIMVGKQLLNNFLEILYPKMYNWWSKRMHRSNTKNLERKYTRWEEDFQLQDPGRLALFEEYLEMVLQYGFVTLFVAAFPLAPLFALLNNIGEIRLDAYKMVTQARRPLAERVQDIGAWYGILQGVTFAAVVSNAFVIAYTSDFIPRMVYKYVYSPTETLAGYIDSSLSEFNTSHYGQDMGADTEEDPPTCQYRGYRNPPTHEKRYDLSPQYWHVFAARLAFVVVFEHIVFALTGIMAYAIPDVPAEVRTQIQREKLLEKEAKYEHGTQGNLSANYGEILLAQRERSLVAAAGAARSWWGRRLSRVSDSLDVQDTTSRQHKVNNSNSTVWEVTR